MANQSATAFGLRPLRNVGQGVHNAGLGEWKKASNSAAINHHELVQLQNSGYVLSSTIATPNNIGSLNGSFYTAPTTSKPTWSNYAPQVVASDHVVLVNDNPQMMFEMRTSITTFTDPGSVGKCSPIVVGSGSGAPNYISGNSIGATGVGSDQIKILGLTRDPNNQDVSVAGSVWRVMINENMLGNNSAGI
tara:strand:- start:34 stop:606 length:573 start_codon:yes stop_codon:yes gene_type:complete